MNGHKLEKAVGNFMKTKVAPGDRVIAAVSGGPDSMAMLDLLLKNRAACGYEVEVAHVHHHLREASDAEWQLVADYCAARGVPFHGRHAYVREATAGQSLEAAAHQLRHAALEEVVRARSAQWLALAHQADDRAETLLMNILRGASLQGLAAMPAREGHLLRPLLPFTKAELETYCQAQAIPYAIDESNADTRILRNRVRHELLPQLAGYNPQIVRALNRLAVSCERDAVYLRDAGAALHERAVCVAAARWTLYRRKDIAGEAEAVLAELVRAAVLRVAEGRGNISGEMVAAALSRIAAGNGRTDLGQGIFCEVTARFVYIGREPQGEWQRDSDGIWQQDFLEARITGPGEIIVRGYKSGDALAMASCHRALKKLLQEFAMPPCLRPLWPVVYDTKIKEIIWSPLLAPTHKLMYYKSATYLQEAITFNIAHYHEQFYLKQREEH